ncbi:MAG: hypothetical protein ACRD2L_00900, partial [Terriglobia bacterium]
MRWLLLALVLWLFTKQWLIATLVAAYCLHRYWSESSPRNTSTTSDRAIVPPQPTSPVRSQQEITDLLILRLELGRQLADGTITREFYSHAVAQIDTLGTETLSRLAIAPESQRWRASRDAAWNLLTQRRLLSPTPPPWKEYQSSSRETVWHQSQQLSLPLPSRSLPQREQSESPLTAIVTPPVQTPRP